MTRSRSPLRTLPLAALGTVLLAAAGATPAQAAKHTPCPTGGRTIAKDVGPNLRVWREGTTLRACSRETGERRFVRTLGTWSRATKVATGEGAVAWTTSRTTDAGPVDAITTIDVRSGRRWLSTKRAAVAQSTTVPAADDRVLKVLTSGYGTAWVTSRGVIGAAVRTVDDESTTYYGEGVPGSEPFHVGRRFFLGDAGPAGAAALAKGLRLDVGGEGDECGGTAAYEVEVPAFADRPAMTFSYALRDYQNPACSNL